MPASPESDLQQRLATIAAKLAQARTTAEAGRVGVPAPQLLRQRALELAKPAAPAEAEEQLAIIEFQLGQQRLACEERWVAEVFRPREIMPIPGAPAPLAGLVNRRGTILPVLDLHPLLGLPETPEEAQPIVLVVADEGSQFGFSAALVRVARKVSRSSLAPPPATWPEPALRYLRGVLPGAVLLLDAVVLLTTMAPQMTPKTSSTL